MSFSTPTHPLESSAKRLLRRVHACTQRSFEQTPSRYTISKRKKIQVPSSTLSSSISLLSNNDQTLMGHHIVSDDSLSLIDAILPENNNRKVS